MNDEAVRRVVFYRRVSTDEQKERASILTQLEGLEHEMLREGAAVSLVGDYMDDGVSGSMPMEEREGGRRLIRDARSGLFDEVWVFKHDRLGRDDVDPLIVRREFTRLGVKIISLHDPVAGDLEYALRVAIAAEERRTTRLRTVAGTARAAREGRYCGGIVPIGYRVEGKKQYARLAVSDDPMWRTWTESDVVRQIYSWCAVDRWSCRRIAEHLNALGVPTAYQVAGRCVRKQRTRGEWTPGRIRQILTSTIYMGIYEYGKRSKDREPIKVPVPAVVSEAVWDEAQRTLAQHNLRPKHAKNVFLLKSVLKCGVCGLNFSGTMGRGVVWYRCNGQIAWRGRLKGKCYAKGIDGRVLEPLVWADVERWLTAPGDLLDELAAEQNRNSAGAVAAAERTLVEKALADIAEQRNRMLDVYRRGRISVDEFETQMDSIVAEQQALDKRRAELEPAFDIVERDVGSAELLDAIRTRVHEGLSAEERQEIVRLLVRHVRVDTAMVDTKKTATVVVAYRFPAVELTDRGIRAGQNYSSLQRVVQL